MTEKTVTASKPQGKKITARTIASVAMFCAIAYVVMLLSKLIPISVSGFLSPDFKDMVVVIAGFILGPLASLFISVFVSVLEMLTWSTTGPIGMLMNILSTCAFALPATIVYKHRHKFSNAVLGLVFGVVMMTVMMLIWNYLVTPLYMGVSREVVTGMLVPVFLPFNLLKGCINAALTILLYKPVINALRAARLIPSHEKTGGEIKTGKRQLGVVILSLLILVACVLLLLILSGIIVL